MEKLITTTVRLTESLKHKLDVYVENHDLVQEKFIARLIRERIDNDTTSEQMSLDIDVTRSGRGYFQPDRAGDHS